MIYEVRLDGGIRGLPQEIYTIIGFDYHRTFEKLENAIELGKVIGDLSGEMIEYTKNVVTLKIKADSENVTFQISPDGKLVISHGDISRLREAKSKLKQLIVGERWVPTSMPSTDLTSQQILMDTVSIGKAIEEGAIETSIEIHDGKPILLYRKTDDSDAVFIEADFRVYRALFEKFDNLGFNSVSKLKDYLDGLCAGCGRKRGVWPSLPLLCWSDERRRECHGSLYSALSQKLGLSDDSEDFCTAACLYLAYECKIEVILAAQRTVKRAFMEEEYVTQWMILESYKKRLRKLRRRQPTLEPPLLRHQWYELLAGEFEDAEKAVRLCMNACRWSIIAHACIDPRAQYEHEKAQKEYSNKFHHFCAKAHQCSRRENPLRRLMKMVNRPDIRRALEKKEMELEGSDNGIL